MDGGSRSMLVLKVTTRLLRRNDWNGFWKQEQEAMLMTILGSEAQRCMNVEE
jgi:hypothetical protein